MMKVVIFGSTGVTGLCAVEAAVKKGLQVRAFLRDPSLLPTHLKPKVEVFQGNVLEPDSVHDAVEGTEYVIIALGTRNSLQPTSDLSEGTRNILEAMRAKNVKIVAGCLSAFVLSGEVPEKYVELNKDHKRMLEAMKESGLNWIAVCPPHITDEASSAITVKVQATSSPGRVISRWDLGAFLVDCVSQPDYYRTVVGIANK